MESEIKRKDLVEDKALTVFKELADAIKLGVKALDQIIDKGKEHQKVLGDTRSLKKLNDEILKLIKEQKDLVKVQDTIIKRVKTLEKENKDLTNQIKKLTEEQKKNKRATQDQSDAFEALDSRVGGTISRLKLLGKELLAIAANPIVLTLGIIIGLLYAASSAVKTFWDRTGEGEDALDKQSNQWNNFFNSLKNRWAELGSTINDAIGGDTIGSINKLITALQFMFPIFRNFLEEVRADFNKTAEDVDKLTDAMDALADRQIKNMVRRANIETELNAINLKIVDDLNNADVTRLVLLERYINLKEEQLRIDIQIAKDNAKYVLLEIGHIHGLTDAQTLRLTEEEKFARFKEDQNRKIAEAQIEVINLEGQYYSEVRKNASKLVNLKQEIYKKEIEAAKKAALEIIQIGRDRVDVEQSVSNKRIAEIQKEYTLRLKDEKLHWTRRKELIEESQLLIKQVQEQSAIDNIENQIKSLEKVFTLIEFDAEEQAKIAKELSTLKLKLIEEYYEQQAKLGKTQLDIDRENLQKTKEIYEDFAGSIGNLFDSLTERRLINIDLEQERIEKSYEKEINLAGDNAEKKAELEQALDVQREEFERKRIDELRRAAIFEKATAAIQAGINTALAVTKALPNIPLAVATGIAGAIQVAAILARPLPQYAEGTPAGGHPGGLMVVGEKGPELMRKPDGSLTLTPGIPTLMYGEKGTHIAPYEDTVRMLAGQALANSTTMDRKPSNVELKELVKKLDTLNRTFKNKPTNSFNISRRGAETMVQNAQTRTYFLNEVYK